MRWSRSSEPLLVGQVLSRSKHQRLPNGVTAKLKRFKPTWYKTIATYGSSQIALASTQHVRSLLPFVGADAPSSSTKISLLDHSFFGNRGRRNDGTYLHSLP